MTASEIMSWSPYVALVVGFFCGLGVARSHRLAGSLLGAAMLVQVIGWTAFYLFAEASVHGWGIWETTLGAGFLAALVSTLPYTAIGAVVGAGVVGAARLRRAPSVR